MELPGVTLDTSTTGCLYDTCLAFICYLGEWWQVLNCLFANVIDLLDNEQFGSIQKEKVKSKYSCFSKMYIDKYLQQEKNVG